MVGETLGCVAVLPEISIGPLDLQTFPGIAFALAFVAAGVVARGG